MTNNYWIRLMAYDQHPDRLLRDAIFLGIPLGVL